jgi:hypothetical protein
MVELWDVEIEPEVRRGWNPYPPGIFGGWNGW